MIHVSLCFHHVSIMFPVMTPLTMLWVIFLLGFCRRYHCCELLIVGRHLTVGSFLRSGVSHYCCEASHCRELLTVGSFYPHCRMLPVGAGWSCRSFPICKSDVFLQMRIREVVQHGILAESVWRFCGQFDFGHVR